MGKRPNRQNKTYVSDGISTPGIGSDIENQSSGNYTYDKIGNLTKDVSEQIGTIEWTVYGKMKKLTRSAGSNKPDLGFGYDAMGNRVWKQVITPLRLGDKEYRTTYYVRDAQTDVPRVS